MSETLRTGEMKLKWAYEHMPVVKEIDSRLTKEKPFRGLMFGITLHVEAKTGVLAMILSNGGAKVCLAGSNPLTTDDSVVAALRESYGINVLSMRNETIDEYYRHLNDVLDVGPDYIIDDGGELTAMIHTTRRDVLSNVKGGCEETTTGITKLRTMTSEKKLEYPMMAVNNSKMKYLFDNRYGTGQSVFDGWQNATNLVIAGKHVVVAGYGWCGKGVAMRARGLGAIVTVTEVDPFKAIEATMDGFQVRRMNDAVRDADLIITVTGCNNVVTADDFAVMKDGCIMGNAGHYNVEISVKELESICTSKEHVRDHMDCYTLSGGKRLYLIGEGRLMNLVAGQGHPAEIMDMSFAAQARSMEYLVKNHDKLGKGLIDVPEEIDRELAFVKLRTMGISIDSLTDEQNQYLHNWQNGT